MRDEIHISSLQRHFKHLKNLCPSQDSLTAHGAVWVNRGSGEMQHFTWKSAKRESVTKESKAWDQDTIKGDVLTWVFFLNMMYNEGFKFKAWLKNNYSSYHLSAAICGQSQSTNVLVCPQSQHVCLCVGHVHDCCHYNSGQVIRLDPHQLCLACQPRSCAKCLVLPDSPLAG